MTPVFPEGHQLTIPAADKKATKGVMFDWTVNTTHKSRTVSSVFFFRLLVVGTNITDDSHYFNIVGGETGIPTGSITTSDAATSSVNIISTTYNWITIPSYTVSSSNTNGWAVDTSAPVPKSTDYDYLNSGAELSIRLTVGIAIAIPCALLAGVVGSHYLFKRRRMQNARRVGPQPGQGDMCKGRWELDTESIPQLQGQVRGAGSPGRSKRGPPVELGESPVVELPMSPYSRDE
jgi:hypothetical protein